jgi:hypothetical protein
MIMDFFVKLSIAPGIVPTIDQYLPPNDTGKYISLSGFIQQDVFLNKTDTNPCGVLVSTSKVTTKAPEISISDVDINGTTYFVNSDFTLFIKNCDDTFSNLPFKLSYVNSDPEPQAKTYLTTSNQGIGAFYNKNVNIKLDYNNDHTPESSWSKITLTVEDEPVDKYHIKEIASIIETIFTVADNLINNHK